ncbi:PTS mannose/fructose/sorbose/N-acetylgalactosamine transporter subunit IIC [Anaerorhabdus sp.]|uniref:PTS mannose/fructose/sorbose/N-acetylgalactosamine transporter subunit IIC n=1 Tax=Anaerorhabdus sp. TaxID=1872524 RepID=UPI002B220842|nr:PTS sugar transporter subunit IIC [Anaerorhabdus sp.]MEA4874197.1 PTS sugar transporter subunit IIC [Anaerorhabdus sp.]
MFIQALLLMLVTAFGEASNGFFGDSFFDRPIVIGSLAALILGDLQTGIVVAATIELMWIGMIFFAPVDTVVGAVIAVFVAIKSGASVEVASTIAIAIGLLGGQIATLVSTGMGIVTSKAAELAEQSKIDTICKLHITAGIIKCFIKSIIVFIAVLLGTEVVQAITGLPANVTSALSAVGSILPAVGFAMLLNILWEKKFLVFYIIGFTVTGYLGLNMMAVAVIAICIGIFYFFMTEKGEA